MARQRRPNPLTIRLPDDERAELIRLAAQSGVSVSGYFRMIAFNTPPRRVARLPDLDRIALIQLAGAIGHIGGHTNQIAHAANMGTQPAPEALARMQADIQWMRYHVMLALGVTPSGPEP